MMTGQDLPEFSRPVLVRSLRDSTATAPREIQIDAKTTERRAIAERLGLLALASLSCRYRLVLQSRGHVAAEGTLMARLTQTCVVTMEPFDDVLVERFSLVFVPEDHLGSDQACDVDALDEVPYVGDHVDLGEAATEQLALSLDPYPRNPAAPRPEGLLSEEQAEAVLGEAEAAEPTRRPFAALDRLKKSGDA